MFIANNMTNYLRRNKYILKSIEEKANTFKNSINNFAINNNLDARVFSYSSMIRIIYSKKKL